VVVPVGDCSGGAVVGGDEQDVIIDHRIMFFVWFQCISFVSVARKFWRALTKTINHKAQRTNAQPQGSSKQQATNETKHEARKKHGTRYVLCYADVCIRAKSKNKSF